MTNYINTHTGAEIDAAYDAMISHDIVIPNEEATD